MADLIKPLTPAATPLENAVTVLGTSAVRHGTTMFNPQHALPNKEAFVRDLAHALRLARYGDRVIHQAIQVCAIEDPIARVRELQRLKDILDEKDLAANAILA